MKQVTLALAVVCCGWAVAAQEVSLFNGKDLAGWDGAPGWWTVEDGALTAQSTPEKPCKTCNYLIWAGGQPDNFELTADFRLSEQANSGIQFRSETRPEWDTYGYQADMTGDGKLVGFVYHHKRGLIAGRGQRVAVAPDGKKTEALLGDPGELLKGFKKGEWNAYRIVCRGPEITLDVNGVMMCQFTDNDTKTAAAKGVIALQMHPGPPMKVQFRNLVLKPLEAAGQGREAALLEILGSGAEVQAKAAACRELARVGTAACVPALAALLADDGLADLARYGMQAIPGPEVDGALRDALGTLKGRPLAGVVGSVGVRRDTQAVAALIGLLSNADSEVARAAALALGKLATPEAATGLQGAIGRSQAGVRDAVCDGLLRCAEAFAADGRASEALAIYDSLRQLPQAPDSVRCGAWRGAVLARRQDGFLLLLEALRGDDYGWALTAARVSAEMREPGVTKALADELGKAAVGRQILLAQTLGKRRDGAALAALLRVAGQGEKAARLEAIRAVAEIGHASAAPVLIGLLNDPEQEIAQVAESSLVSLPGTEVDAAVLGVLGGQGGALRVKLIDVAAQRRLMKALPLLRAAASDQDAAVRLAAIKGYGSLAGTAELPFLLERVLASVKQEELEAFEKALGSVCSGAEEEAGERVRLLCVALSQSRAEVKPVLLRTLRVAGGPAALEAVRCAAIDGDKAVQAAAIRVISEWKTADAAPVLLERAANAVDRVDKLVSLRGYMGMASKNELPAQARIAICRQAAPLITRAEEKRLLLGTLREIADAESLGLALAYVDDQDVKEEAIAAVLGMTEKPVRPQQSGAARAALEKVAHAAADKPEVVKQVDARIKRLAGDK
jgi:HEAT repeat protein